jgi:isopentenyl phosphate kinase
VITTKETPETVDETALNAAARAVADATEPVVLVHGAGSFGHHHANRHNVSPTRGTNDDRAIREIHQAMVRLNGEVLTALAGAGTHPVPVHPFSVARRTADAELELPTRHVESMVREGFMPVLHGDMVVHETAGATVLSGDEIVVELARSLNPEGVGLCSTVPGVLTPDDEVIESIHAYDEVADFLDGSDTTDVTGGMAGKIRSLLSLTVPASVFGPEDLEAFLAGDQPGTTVE